MVVILSLVSGVLAYLSFAPTGIWWCAPLSLAILIHLLNDLEFRRRLLATAVFSAAFFGPLLAWSNTYVGDVPWLILSVLQIVLTLPLALIPMNRVRNLIFFPSLWVAVEFVRGHVPFNGFGWGRLAFSQADSPYVQLARMGGAPLISFFVAFIAIGIYLVSQLRFAIAFAVLASVAVISMSVDVSKPSLSLKSFSILAVQGGVPSLGLDFNSRATAVFENHLKTTSDYLEAHSFRPDVVLWPENSIDVDPFKDPVVHDQLQTLSDKYDLAFIVGAVLQDGSHFQNASILWQPNKGPTSIYIKRHLTPFGEYIPLRKLAEIVSPYAKNVVDFVPGNRIVTHKVGRATFAPIICFELLDDASGRAMANRSNAFVVQTNSATFGRSPESEQQLGITRIRAIEHQRYLVSVSTSGISALVDPRGGVTHRTALDHSAVIAATIGLSNARTISDRFGSPIEATLILFPPFAALFGRPKRRRGRGLK